MKNEGKAVDGRAFRETPIGLIGIEERAGAVCRLYFDREARSLAEFKSARETSLIQEAFRQLGEYLEGKRKIFTFSLCPEGTSFMCAEWEALRQIPYGTVTTYKALAEKLGRPLAYRAVGYANGHNPIPIFIPCHRVVGSDGGLTGFGGGLALKKRLLSLEAAHS